jgi:hypothetical protein
MAYRLFINGMGLGKHFEVNPDNPKQAAICDRCGRRYNLDKLRYQMDYNGTIGLINKQVMVCDTCYDAPATQLQAYSVSEDPPSLYNIRPEAYTLDESDWLMTEDGDTLTTQEGEKLIPTLPNPNSTASLVEQAAVILTTEDDAEIVTEAGEGNPLNFEPNP